MAFTTTTPRFTPRFKIDFYLNTTTKKIKFTDIIAGDYNTLYSLTLADIKGLVKITGPNGIIYQNAGWATDNFDTPDIDGSGTPDWVEDDIALPLDADSEVQLGEYLFEYKLSIDGGTNLYYLTQKTYDYQFENPVIEINTTHSCKYSTLSILDATTYEVDDIEPSTKTRTTTVEYPITSGESDVTSSVQKVTVGPNIYSGSYNLSISSILYFELEQWDTPYWFNVYTTVVGEEAHEVICDNCASEVVNCVKNLKNKYDEAILSGNSVKIKEYTDLLFKITVNWMLYEMYESNGYDSSEFINNIKELSITSGCSCTSGDDSSTEIIPWASASASTSTAGSIWYYGDGVPGAGLGVNTDYYLDQGLSYTSKKGNIYTKTAGAWVLILNINGAPGAAGTAGVGVLVNNIADVPNLAAASETILKTYTMPGDTLDTNGDIIHIVGLCELALNGNGKTVYLRFEGTDISVYYTTTTVVDSTKVVKMEAWISRTGAATQFAETQKIRGGNPNKTNGPTISTLTKTLSSTIDIIMAGKSDASALGDIVGKQLKVEIINKA